MTERLGQSGAPETDVLATIADKKATRDDVAFEYAWLMASAGTNGADYSKVNHAILDRWSMNALKYIKEKAWKIVRSNAG